MASYNNFIYNGIIKYCVVRVQKRAYIFENNCAIFVDWKKKEWDKKKQLTKIFHRCNELHCWIHANVWFCFSYVFVIVDCVCVFLFFFAFYTVEIPALVGWQKFYHTISVLFYTRWPKQLLIHLITSTFFFTKQCRFYRMANNVSVYVSVKMRI